MTDRDASPATCNGVGTRTRELAQRLSGAVEVLLLWRPDIDQVELSVRDSATGAGFDLEVAPANAIDAFNHPYAYAAARQNSHCVGQDDTTVIDG